MKTCAPTGATVIGCKCYWVLLVLGATVFHHFFFKKDYNKTGTECSEKWSKFHTRKGCEDEVNRKCHLTKP